MLAEAEGVVGEDELSPRAEVQNRRLHARLTKPGWNLFVRLVSRWSKAFQGDDEKAESAGHAVPSHVREEQPGIAVLAGLDEDAFSSKRCAGLA